MDSSNRTRSPAVVLLGIGAVVVISALSACRDEPVAPDTGGRSYVDRTLEIDADYLTPDIEGRLVEPEPEYFVPSDEPLDRDRFGEYLHDQEAIIRDAATESAGERIEELLFE